METSKRKKNILFITILSVVGLVGAMALQMIWIYNSYELIRNDLLKVSSEVFEKALREETNLACKEIPEGTEILAGPESDSIPSITYLYEGIQNLGIEMSINRMDSLVEIFLKDKDISNNHYINIIDIKNDTIIKSTSENQADLDDRLNSKIIPIKTDLSQGVQLVLLNPYIYIFKRMGLMLAGTFIIMLLVIVCIRQEMKDKYFDIAENEADHLLTLTNKVLTISKLENHKLEMNRTEVELIPIIEKLTEKFKAKSQKTVNFITDIKAETAYADAEYLEEVISNLIDNSIKYSDESVEIKISTAQDDRYTMMKIRDNGFGISEKDIHLIFQKFERASAIKRSRKNGASGFGLGLSFVDQVVKAHHGKIFVTSIEGEFTEFIIYLPLTDSEE